MLPQTLRTTDIRLSNKLHLLQFVRQRGEVTKPEIEKQLGFSAPTVSTLIDEMVHEGFIKYKGMGSSTGQGGKRPKIFTFNPTGRGIIGIHIGVRSIQAALMDLEANILFRVDCPLKPKVQIHTMMSILDSLIKECVDEARRRHIFLLGIGLGCPGVVDFKTGKVLRSINMPVLEQESFGDIWIKEYDIPAWIDNECNNLALGEKWFGLTGAAGTTLNLLTEEGIGAGIIIDEQLIRGASNSFGEVGHMVIERDGAQCHCGNRGCWEMHSSTSALLSLLEKYANQSAILTEALEQNGELTMDDIVNALEADDKVTQSIAIKELSISLSIGLTNLVNIFNPDAIIVHGEMTRLGAPLLSELRRIVKEQALPISAEQVHIAFSELGEEAHLIGAGALCIKELFEFPEALFRKDETI
ncbi:xylose repressor [Paenibacillus baekrokdamisoli]|uniref:Xylose repressor n=1 Tax=Paenibacillus baekrokdamisoli TaxID=1712516 RepID=A0A3G9IJ08_9BACL|nr:ROK family transcriptional regulator [Paenibacillus baekrokdamisoli]MBB3072704.1 putative NBD/HSP70 family sugar kinase [Paenibacillus baekrokdamisoli]BBH18987.1 xylose repressor [Paenibacillus baekrokdamisoli]